MNEKPNGEEVSVEAPTPRVIISFAEDGTFDVTITEEVTAAQLFIAASMCNRFGNMYLDAGEIEAAATEPKLVRAAALPSDHLGPKGVRRN